MADLFGERGAKFFHCGHELESDSTLEELTAVQPAPENEMTVQEGSRILENLQDFFFRHGPRVEGELPHDKTRASCHWRTACETGR
jgi:hypothetical protein